MLGIPVGLGLGLVLGIPAGRPDPEGLAYSSFPRRSARLGHVAAVMLPLLGGFYGLAIPVLNASVACPLWAARTWQLGSTALVLVLFGAAWKAQVRWLLPIPALALTASTIAFAATALS